MKIDYNKALEFAATAHQGQKVPGSDWPYLVHLGRVAMEIMIAMQTEQDLDYNLAVQCALLHDTLEDTDVSKQDIVREFGPKVAEGVAALTKDKSIPKSEAMADSLARIKLQPHEIWMVKMADRISNLGPPPKHWDKNKIKAYMEEARVIHGALKDAICIWRIGFLRKLNNIKPTFQSIKDNY